MNWYRMVCFGSDSFFMSLIEHTILNVINHELLSCAPVFDK